MPFRHWPVGWKLFRHRCGVVPFETALAAIAIWTGAASLFNYSVAARAFNSALPHQFTMAFNIVYIVAGAFMLLGIGWAYRNIESSGVILFSTVLFVRVISLLFIAGWAPETVAAIVQGFTFGVAAMIRLYALLRNRTLVYAEDIPAIVLSQVKDQGYKP